MNKTEKGAVVDRFAQEWAASKGAVLLDFRGVTVAEITALRKKLRGGGISLRVVKNTLAVRAIGKDKAAPLRKHLQGPTAIALSSGESMLPAKLLWDAKKSIEKLSLKAVLIEGALYEGGAIEEIANLPSREELLAKLVGSLAAPLQGLVMTLSAIVRDFVSTTDAVRSKKEKEAPPAA